MGEHIEYRVVGEHPLYGHLVVPWSRGNWDEAYEARRTYRKVYRNARIQQRSMTEWTDLEEADHAT